MANGDTSTPDVSTILADPNFHALPPMEKQKVLLKVDPNYRGLSPQEQAKALNVIQYGPLPKEPSTASKVAREGALGLASGVSGLPETMHPVRDMFQPPSLWQALDPTGGALTSAYGAAKRVYGAGKEAVQGALHGDPEKMAHGAGSLVGQAAQFTGAKEAPEATRESPMEAWKARNIRKGTEKVGAALKVPTSEEAVAAATGKSLNLGMDEARDLATARDDLAKIERDNPVTAKGSAGTFARAKNTFDYARNLWKKAHEEPIKRHEVMSFDKRPNGLPMTSLVDAGNAVLTDEAKDADPAGGRAAQRWVNGLAKPRTLGSADKLLREINNDISSPKAEDRYGNLMLRAKSAVAKQIRENIDTLLEDSGESGVRAANRRWAALQTVGARMIKEALAEDAKAGRAGPMPDWVHMYTFLHPSLESILSVGAGVNAAKMFRPSPSRMLAKGMTRLAKSRLEPPPMPTPPPPPPPAGTP